MNKRITAIGIAIILSTLVFSLSAWAVGPQRTDASPYAAAGGATDLVQPDLPRTPYPDSWPPDGRPLNGWTEVFYEDFEDSFPDGWETQGWPDYKWWKRDCRSHEGDYSAWCMGRSTDDARAFQPRTGSIRGSTLLLPARRELPDGRWSGFRISERVKLPRLRPSQDNGGRVSGRVV